MDAFLGGLRDAFDVRRLLLLLLTHSHISMLLFKSYLLNGCLFLGSLLLSNYLAQHQLWLASFLLYVLWIYPVYLLLFTLNAKYYSQITQHLIHLQHTRHSHTQHEPILKDYRVFSVEEEIYRVLWMTIALAEINTIYYLPYIGMPLSFLLSVYTYALYTFEYFLNSPLSPLLASNTAGSDQSPPNKIIGTDAKLAYIQHHYIYFFAFGLPLTALTFFFTNVLLGMALFWLLFPLYLILAFFSRPVKHCSLTDQNPTTWLPTDVRVFWVIDAVNLYILRMLGRLFLKPSHD